MHHDRRFANIANALGLDLDSDENAILAQIRQIRSDDLRSEVREIAESLRILIEKVEQGATKHVTTPKPPQLIKAISASGIKPGSKYKLDRDPEVKELVLSMILEGGHKYVEIEEIVEKRFGKDRSVSASSIQRYVRVMRRKHPEWR